MHRTKGGLPGGTESTVTATRDLADVMPRLLAIDDSPWIHRLLRGRLRGEHLEVHSAMSGQQGLDVARVLNPDVILLDLELPDIDGFGLIEALKEHPDTNEIPIVVLSSCTSTQNKVRAFDLGAMDFVSKPFDVAELKVRIRSAVRQHHLVKMLAQKARIDGLTGLWNRAHFDQRLADEIRHATRHHLPLSLMLADLDRFKSLNDQFGHPFGDRVLERFAHMLQLGRASDVACRYGGEEFAIIMPSTTAEEARGLADRIRRNLRDFVWEWNPGLSITASFGVTDIIRAGQPTPEAIVKAADEALYEAKAAGRDRVVMAPDPELRTTASA